jgi:hypothetical protein
MKRGTIAAAWILVLLNCGDLPPAMAMGSGLDL